MDWHDSKWVVMDLPLANELPQFGHWIGEDLRLDMAYGMISGSEMNMM